MGAAIRLIMMTPPFSHVFSVVVGITLQILFNYMLLWDEDGYPKMARRRNYKKALAFTEK